jgi:acyl dehydratase
MSLIPVLLDEIYFVDGIEMGINYGCNKVRFPAPVPVGSRVRGGAELVRADREGRRALVELRVTVDCEGVSKPVCVADSLAILYAAEIEPAQSDPSSGDLASSHEDQAGV